MGKRLILWADARPFCLVFFMLVAVSILPAADVILPALSSVANSRLQRAQADFERIQSLAADGTLPKARLEQAKEDLADAQDSEILSETLYSSGRLQDMTPERASEMVEAAQRRVARQQKIVDQRTAFLDQGIIAKADLAGAQEELQSRQRVLDLARNRSRLLDELREMAAAEQKLERAATAGSSSSLKDSMIRYQGNGAFQLSDLTTISSEYERHFHSPLPVSALGQTLVHQSMGLDHRNRVDVALAPESTQGLWLRQVLERRHVPYLAFRSAVIGAATAPHIHIGLGSTRLKLASR